MTEIIKNTGSLSSFDGTSIYYEVRGSGEPIIFVYGIACLMNHWHHQIDYFSKSYQVITFDIRGHHKSTVPENLNNLTIESIAQDIQSLMTHLGLQSAHFAGHSFGVPILIQLAAMSPEKIKSLIFINGFSKNPIKGMFGLDVVESIFDLVKSQYDHNPTLWNSLWKTATNNQISMWLSGLAGGFNLRLTQFKDIEIYAKGVAQIPLEVFMPLFEDLMKFNGDDHLGHIKAPTLILSGDHDMVTPLKFQEEMHSLIKGSEFVVIPYGSHCTQLDFPDYVNLKMEKFLS